METKTLYRAGGAAAVLMLALIPIQMALYIAFPPPEDALGFFVMFQENRLVGLLALDLLYIVDMLLNGLVFLALWAALRKTNASLMTIAIALVIANTGAYLASNTAFPMLWLSDRWAAAADASQEATFVAAGEAMLASYMGNANSLTYVLFGVAGFLTAWVMLKSGVFSRTTAYLGLFMNAMMVVPSTAGTIGMAMAFASLVPLVAWLVLVAIRLFQLAREGAEETPGFRVGRRIPVT